MGEPGSACSEEHNKGIVCKQQIIQGHWEKKGLSRSFDGKTKLQKVLGIRPSQWGAGLAYMRP